MKKYIFTVCPGRCGQVSLSNYINKFSINTLAEFEPPEPKYSQKFIFSSFVRNLERKIYASEEMLGRGQALLWHDQNKTKEMNSLCKKRIKRANKLLEKKNKQIYFEISKFFIRSYGERTIELLPNIKILYLTRNPLHNAISFFNRKKNFEKDNFKLGFKKNIFKIKDLELFEKYLWAWIEIKLRLLNIRKKYNCEIINFKSENIDNIILLKKLFSQLDIEHNEIMAQKIMNSNKSLGLPNTIVNDFFLSKYENFKKKIPNNIKGKVQEFFDYDQI